MKGKSVKFAVGIAAVLAIAAILLGFSWPKEEGLILRDPRTREVYTSFPLEEGGRFSITFIHSVNKTPLTDVYEIRGGDIYVVETKYYSFGAGVQTELEEGQSLSYAEDGAMIISGFDKKMTGMVYVVGKISDHVLKIGEADYSLTELCGKGSAVEFVYRR